MAHAELRRLKYALFTAGNPRFIKASYFLCSADGAWHAENQEAMQVLRYGIGQKYSPHTDYFENEAGMEEGGMRYATVLMYLSDVALGGETAFPSAQVMRIAAIGGMDCSHGCLRNGSVERHERTL